MNTIDQRDSARPRRFPQPSRRTMSRWRLSPVGIPWIELAGHNQRGKQWPRDADGCLGHDRIHLGLRVCRPGRNVQAVAPGRQPNLGFDGIVHDFDVEPAAAGGKRSQYWVLSKSIPAPGGMSGTRELCAGKCHHPHNSSESILHLVSHLIAARRNLHQSTASHRAGPVCNVDRRSDIDTLMSALRHAMSRCRNGTVGPLPTGQSMTAAARRVNRFVRQGA